MKNKRNRFFYKIIFFIFIFLFPVIMLKFILKSNFNPQVYLEFLIFECVISLAIYIILELRIVSYYVYFKKRIDNIISKKDTKKLESRYKQLVSFDTLTNLEYFFNEEIEHILNKIETQGKTIENLERENYNRYNLREYQLRSAIQELEKVNETFKKKEDFLETTIQVIENIDKNDVTYRVFFDELLYYFTTMFNFENVVIVKFENDDLEIFSKSAREIIFDSTVLDRIKTYPKRIISKDELNSETGFNLILKMYIDNEVHGLLLIGKISEDAVDFSLKIKILENFSIEISNILDKLYQIENLKSEKEVLYNKIKDISEKLTTTEENLDIQLEQITDMYEEIVTLYEAGKAIGRVYDIKDIEKLILEMILEIVEADVGMVYYYSEGKHAATAISNVIFAKDNSDEFKKEIKTWFVSSSIFEDVKQKRSDIIINDISESDYFFTLGDKLKWKIKSFITIPIFHGKDIFGGLAIVKKSEHDYFSAANIKLITALTNQLGISVQNIEFLNKEIESKKEEEQLKIASEIEAKLFPQSMPQIKNFEFYGMNVPAKSVGGDYYDLIKIDDDLVVGIIADVSGKGIPAALLVSMFRTAFRMLVKRIKFISPKQILENINEMICDENLEGRFITAVCFLVDNKNNKITISNAGHDPIIIFRESSETISEEDTDGLVLGIMDGEKYEEKDIEIKKGDIVTLFTDGVVEARNSETGFFGFERLHEIIKTNNKYPADYIVRKIYREVTKFLGTSVQNDDITIITIKGV